MGFDKCVVTEPGPNHDGGRFRQPRKFSLPLDPNAVPHPSPLATTTLLSACPLAEGLQHVAAFVTALNSLWHLDDIDGVLWTPRRGWGAPWAPIQVNVDCE